MVFSNAKDEVSSQYILTCEIIVLCVVTLMFLHGRRKSARFGLNDIRHVADLFRSYFFMNDIFIYKCFCKYCNSFTVPNGICL
jgi:hypothetical protein